LQLGKEKGSLLKKISKEKHYKPTPLTVHADLPEGGGVVLGGELNHMKAKNVKKRGDNQ